MTVYIDVLIVLNIYITYFILKSAARFFHISYKFGRIAFASVLGGISALAALIEAGFFPALSIKVCVTAVIVFTAFGYNGIKPFLMRIFVCTGISMLLSGLTIMLHEISGSSFIFAANGYVYMDISALILVISSAAIYGIMTVLRRFLDRPSSDSRIKLIIRNNGASAELSAFGDSGNCLCDFLTGLPVILCTPQKLDGVMPQSAEQYLCGCTDDLSGIRIIPMRTADGESTAAAFRPEKITAEIGGAKKDITALIGVKKDALNGEDFDAVINPKLLI